MFSEVEAEWDNDSLRDEVLEAVRAAGHAAHHPAPDTHHDGHHDGQGTRTDEPAQPREPDDGGSRIEG